MTTRVTRPLLGLATAATLITAAFGITACTASNRATAPATTIAPSTATPNPGAVVYHPTTSATASTTATTRAHAALTTTTPTTAPGTPPATTATTGSGPVTTDSPAPTTGTPGSPTITYRVTNTDGPLVTLTTNGAVYIIRDQNPVTLAPTLVVTVTVARDLDTNGVDIKAVEAAYRGYVETGDEATHDPNRDWRQSFARYTAEPFLTTILGQVASMAQAQVRSVGHAAYSAAITSAEPHQATLEVCNDVSGLDRVDSATGISVKVDAGDRHPQDVTLSRADDGKWFVSDVQARIEATC